MLVSHGRECVRRDPPQEWRGVESDGIERERTIAEENRMGAIGLISGLLLC